MLDKILDYEINSKLSPLGSPVPGFRFSVPKEHWHYTPTVRDFFAIESHDQDPGDGNITSFTTSAGIPEIVWKYDLINTAIDDYVISGFFYKLDPNGTIVEFVFESHVFIENPDPTPGEDTKIAIGPITRAANIGATPLIFSTMIAAMIDILLDSTDIRVLIFFTSSEMLAGEQRGASQRKLYDIMTSRIARKVNVNYLKPPIEEALLELKQDGDDFFTYVYNYLSSEYGSDLREEGDGDVFLLYRYGFSNPI